MGDQLVDTIVDLATEVMQREHQLSLQRDWIVELDSTTAAKFSRHLIVRCISAGNFMLRPAELRSCLRS